MDIVRNCNNGILVDTTQSKNIAEAAQTIITDQKRWKTYSKNGITCVRKHYTSDSHAATYLSAISETLAVNGRSALQKAVPRNAIGRSLAGLNAFFITDIDNTLIGGENDRLETLLQLKEKPYAI